MKKMALLAVTLLSGLSISAFAGDDQNACPLHAQHMAEASHQAMTARGDQVMGFSAAKTTHHFRILEDGGAIEVTANDAADAVSVGQIRKHLSNVAEEFATGDFSMPEKTHAMTPPGAAEMTKLRARIHYRYEEIDRGGRVRISTEDPDALRAVQSFLKFQIDEHRTGDPH